MDIGAFSFFCLHFENVEINVMMLLDNRQQGFKLLELLSAA